ncbi:Abi-alpha family protein [Mycolicibacterium sp. HS_4_1]
MSQETDNPEPEVTDDLPVNREGLERHGIKVSTPIGEIAIAISTPRGGLAIPKRFDPLGLANRALGVAKFGFKLAAWGGEQIAIATKTTVEAIEMAPERTPAPAPQKQQKQPAAQSLHGKLGGLLDRALDQSTADGRTELYHRLLDQLVADEARIIGALSDNESSPLVNIYPRNRSVATLENACLIGRTANVALPQMVPQYVSHLLALGLVETVPEDPDLKADYEILSAESMVLKAIKDASRGPFPARVEKLALQLSELGRGLWEAAMQDES